MLILRTIEQEIFKSDINVVNVYAHIAAVMHLLNNKRHEIQLIEEKYGITLNFHHDMNATSDSFAIEKIRGTDSTTRTKIDNSKPALALSTNLFEGSAESISENKPIAHSASPGQKQRRTKKWKDKPSEVEVVKSDTEDVDVTANTEQTHEKTFKKRRNNNKHKEQQEEKIEVTTSEKTAPLSQIAPERKNNHTTKQHKHSYKSKTPTKDSEEVTNLAPETNTGEKAPGTRRRKTDKKPAFKNNEA
jgi:hypothetical protein